MKTLLISLALLIPATAIEEGFTPLFNGKDLTGWKRVNGNGEFKVEGDSIVGTGRNVKKNTFLITEKRFRDFDFRFEMKMDDLTGNSGMMFRANQKPGEDGRVFGYQCEHGNRPERAWTGGIFDEARRGWIAPDKGSKEQAAAFTEQGKKLIKWDDWNDIRILCEGRRIRIWLNGEERVDFTDEGEEFTSEGFFGMQVHSGKSCNVRWRNLRIKELNPKDS